MIGHDMNCSCCKYSRNSSGNVQFPGHQSIPARSCVTLLKTYKRFVSPFLPPSCRFTPTCSEYAIDAIRKRGLVRGMIMAVCRLLRCHPFARGGYDPVE